MTEITRNVVKANGISQHYREAGQGPAMILLHGWPQTSYSWRKVISPLSERYRVIAPDLAPPDSDALPPTRSQANKWTKIIQKRLGTWVCDTVSVQIRKEIKRTPIVSPIWQSKPITPLVGRIPPWEAFYSC